MSLLLKLSNLGLGVVDTVSRNLQHSIGMERDIGSRPRIRSGRQIIGVGFAGHLKHRHRNLLRHFALRVEPFSIRPGVHHGSSVLIPSFRLRLDVEKGVEDLGEVQYTTNRIDALK
jgi:hypothetical protein